MTKNETITKLEVIKQTPIKAAKQAIGRLVHVFHDPYTYTDNHGLVQHRNRMGYPQAELAGGLAYALRNLASQLANSTIPKAVDRVKKLQQELNHNNVEEALRAAEYVETLQEQLLYLEELACEAERVYEVECDPVARERRQDRIMKAQAKRNATPIDDSQIKAVSERLAAITDKVRAADDVNSVH